jgi:DNA topoisomerase-3
MKTLILTEKPSVARDFATALGVLGRQDGYLENDGYIITWAIGHLVTLKEPQEYKEQWAKWDLNTMPIIPENIEYKPIEQSKKQLKTIQALLKQGSFKKIIIATDAGREGEVIARTILFYAGFKKETCPIFRFWTSQALTPAVIKTGLSSLRPLSEYDRLWNAGKNRQEADWLVGMNLSRAVTLSFSSKTVFSVGRVQTAVLSLLVDRLRDRENFVSTPYWLIHAEFKNEKGNWTGTWFNPEGTRILSENIATNITQKISGRNGSVVQATKEQKRKAPPLLYSLTDLQRDANTHLGYSAQKTLDLCQGLYESDKCLSYPRTDSKVLGSQNVDMVQNIIKNLSGVYPDLFAGLDHNLTSLSNKRVYNDSKLTDHHALIPLAPCPRDLPQDKQKIYNMVLNRFAAAFHPDCEYLHTEIITEVEKEKFKTTGNVILKAGWTVLFSTSNDKETEKDDENREYENLPDLHEGDRAQVINALSPKKMTSPPPEYTEAALLKDMTNPGKYVTEEQLKKIFRGEVGLGTQATRAQIIETLIKREYTIRKGKNIMATTKGCFLIHNIRKLGAAGTVASPDATAAWELCLEKIASGNDTGTSFITGIHNFIKESVNQIRNGSGATYTPPVAESLGVCPACGGKVVEGKKGFGCANYKEGCKFVIWKEISGKTLTRNMVADLLIKKKTNVLKGFYSKKSEKKFDAALALVLSQQNHLYEIKFDFGKK